MLNEESDPLPLEKNKKSDIIGLFINQIGLRLLFTYNYLSKRLLRIKVNLVCVLRKAVSCF